MNTELQRTHTVSSPRGAVRRPEEETFQCLWLQPQWACTRLFSCKQTLFCHLWTLVCQTAQTGWDEDGPQPQINVRSLQGEKGRKTPSTGFSNYVKCDSLSLLSLSLSSLSLSLSLLSLSLSLSLSLPLSLYLPLSPFNPKVAPGNFTTQWPQVLLMKWDLCNVTSFPRTQISFVQCCTSLKV